jgi:hypothetical protein
MAVPGGSLPPSFDSEIVQAKWGLPGARRAAGGSLAATGRWPGSTSPLLACEPAKGAVRDVIAASTARHRSSDFTFSGSCVGGWQAAPVQR